MNYGGILFSGTKCTTVEILEHVLPAECDNRSGVSGLSAVNSET